MRLPRLLLMLVLLAVPAAAHPSLQNSMWILFGVDRIQIAVNVSLKEVLVAGGLAERDDGLYAADALDSAAGKHRDYVRAHLHLAIDGKEIAGRVVNVTPPPILGSVEQSFYQYELEYPGSTPPPAEVVLRHDMLSEFPYAPGQAWDVSYAARVKRAGSDEVSTWLLKVGQPSTLPTGWPATPAPAAPPSASGKPRYSRKVVGPGLVVIVAAVVSVLFRRRSQFR